MKNWNFFTATFFLVVSIFGLNTPTMGNTNSGILILIDDRNADTISRSSVIATSAVGHISGILYDEGFDIYQLDDIFIDKNDKKGGVEINHSDIAQKVKASKIKGIKAYLVVTIYASIRRSNDHQDIAVRMAFSATSMKNGMRIGNLELEDKKTMELPCTRECVLSSVKQLVDLLAKTGASALLEKRSLLLSEDTGNQYKIEFRNFSSNQIMNFEEYLAVFSGYKNHRLISSEEDKTIFWYKSDISSTKLYRNFTKMLLHLDLKGKVVSDDKCACDMKYILTRLQ